MSDSLFIPSRLKVGFDKRDCTYTGKLAYVIYYDATGKLRKEKSWEGWRDKTIDPIEIDNLPSSGFVLNKGVQRCGHGWGGGRSVVRVYDTRDFEFEITVDNLIGILAHSDVSKRDIVQECVYAWKGTELVLLPTNSEAYQASVTHTKKQAQKLSTNDLMEGYTYSRKTNTDVYMYLGKRMCYADPNTRWCDGKLPDQTINQTKYVFYNTMHNTFETLSPPQLADTVSTNVSDNYSFIVDQFLDSRYGSLVNAIEIHSVPDVEQLLQTSEWQHIKLYRFDGVYLYNWSVYCGHGEARRAWLDVGCDSNIIYHSGQCGVWEITRSPNNGIVADRLARRPHYNQLPVDKAEQAYVDETNWIKNNVEPIGVPTDNKYTGRQWLTAFVAAGYGKLVYSTANSDQFFNINHEKL